MARPNLLNHRKFLRFVHLLQIPTAHALGHLEMLWQRCYENGESYLGDEMDVELAAGWTGEAGKLCNALEICGAPRAGFIERIKGDGYQIHDLLDHAPDYVRKRAQREAERRTTADNVRRTAENVRTPAPAPAPAPTPKKKEKKHGGKPPARDRFAEFWERYPRRIAKSAALKAWEKIGGNEKADSIMARLEAFRREVDEAETEERFIPHPATWLNREDFSEPVESPQIPDGAGVPPWTRWLNSLTPEERAAVEERMHAEGTDAVRPLYIAWRRSVGLAV